MPNDDLEARYRQASPRSRELFEQGRGHTAGAAKGAYFYPPYPLTMARGEGCHLWDVDGRCYLDFANHHTAQVLGHGHPAVQKAVDEQMRKGIALGAPTGIESEIAREMCRRVDALERIRFVNSGTEATLHAIRLARGYSQKGKIAKFEGGYHGSHDEGGDPVPLATYSCQTNATPPTFPMAKMVASDKLTNTNTSCTTSVRTTAHRPL